MLGFNFEAEDIFKPGRGGGGEPRIPRDVLDHFGSHLENLWLGWTLAPKAHIQVSKHGVDSRRPVQN